MSDDEELRPEELEDVFAGPDGLILAAPLTSAALRVSEDLARARG